MTADWLCETTYQIGYMAGKDNKYPKYDDIGPTRIELITENDEYYILKVPTNDSLSIILQKNKENLKIPYITCTDFKK